MKFLNCMTLTLLASLICKAKSKNVKNMPLGINSGGNMHASTFLVFKAHLSLACSANTYKVKHFNKINA
jgi:hypothetical protein